MGKRNPEFQLGTYSRILDKKCHKCDKMFGVGDYVVGNTGGHKKVIKRNYYHKECWDKLFI